MKSENYQNFQIFSFSQLASTNDTAFEMIENGQAGHNDVITCDSQTSGRGRLDRKWQEGVGNLYLSLILRPEIDVKNAPQLVFVAINALHDAINELFTEKSVDQGIEIAKKWPNDLLINDKKVAGILLENKMSGSRVDAVVIGLGVNIANNPENVMFEAGNLDEFGLNVEKSQVLRKFLSNFSSNYQSWQDFGFKVVRNKFVNSAWHLKKEVTISNDKVKATGVFIDVSEDGAMVLDTSEGSQEISFGDVS